MFVVAVVVCVVAVCYVMSCSYMLCYVMLWCVVLCGVMIRCVVVVLLCYAMPVEANGAFWVLLDPPKSKSKSKPKRYIAVACEPRGDYIVLEALAI